MKNKDVFLKPQLKSFNVELDKSYFNNASNAVLVLISLNKTECQIQTSLFDLLKVNEKEGLKIWCFCNTR